MKNMNKYLKIFLQLVALFLGVTVAGLFFFPFLAWLTGAMIGYLCLYVGGGVVLVGILMLVVAFVEKRSKEPSLWVITTGCVLCWCFVPMAERYDECARYKGDCIGFCDVVSIDEKSPNYYGLANRFGRTFIEPKYWEIVEVYDNELHEPYYVGCKELKYHKEERLYEYELHFYDASGNLREVDDMKNNDCETLREYFETYVGNIIEFYDDYSDIDWHKLVKAPCGSSNSRSSRGTGSSSNASSAGSSSQSGSQHTPQPHKQTIPVQVWKNCLGCLGSGQCQYCLGQGVIYDAYGAHDCPVCTNGSCSYCAGRGGHYETEYQTRTDYY